MEVPSIPTSPNEKTRPENTRRRPTVATMEEIRVAKSGKAVATRRFTPRNPSASDGNAPDAA